jgi:hypothetical protein
VLKRYVLALKCRHDQSTVNGFSLEEKRVVELFISPDETVYADPTFRLGMLYLR